MMMQRLVWFLMVCGGLLVGCGSVGSGGSVARGNTGSGEVETPVDEGGSGDVVAEGEGTGGESEGESGGEVTDSGGGGESGGESTGGESGGGGAGEVTGDAGGGEPPDPETVDERFIRLGNSFERINTMFQGGTPYAVVNLQDQGSTPTAGAIAYAGQFNLETYTVSPYVHGRMRGDAEISIATSSLLISGQATGFVGNFLKPGVSELVAYEGTLSLNGGQNPSSTGANDDVQINVTGDLTHDIYTFSVDGILGGSLSGTGGNAFRADANNEVSGTPIAVGDIAVQIYGNDASNTSAVLVLERTATNP